MRDGLPDHGAESYVREKGKSMKAIDLAVSSKDHWRNISITPTIPARHTLGCAEKPARRERQAIGFTSRIFGDWIVPKPHDFRTMAGQD
jgi:hypothetical protein